jgi:hypothetical protein
MGAGGPKGTDGRDGVDGASGPKGPTGATGPRGLDGQLIGGGGGGGVAVDNSGVAVNGGKVVGEIDFSTGLSAVQSGAKVVVTASGGGGGGAISVTDGSTTVNPATTLTLPAGSVTDGGGGDAVVAIPASGVVVSPTVAGQTDVQAALTVEQAEIVSIGLVTARVTQTDGQTLTDVDFDIGSQWTEPLIHYDIEYLALTATRTVTLPDTNIVSFTNSALFSFTDFAGDCSATIRLKIVCAGSDVIINAGAGPAPATEYDLVTPYATLLMRIVAAGFWEILAFGAHQAAYVNPLTATPEQIVNALIASGRMAAA